ncbi:MAG: hypothetical protein E6H64_14315 [Betaproteobacteria bacterium]|nr:MAG: hypothetical protein E6H64_14315 [Betaproteobacteria bacterium]
MKTSIYRQHAGLVYAVADPIDRGRADESVDSQVSVDFTRQRRAQPVAFLLPSTQKWLEGLPRRVQPHVLCDYYPRIANSLAAVWEDTEGLRAYFDGLFIDRRGGRQGFPSDVLNDLRVLRYYLAASLLDNPDSKGPGK